MILRDKVLLLMGLVLLCGPIAHGQQGEVEFNMVLSKDHLGINERLRVDFTMNQDGDNFIPPPFEGFKVVMGPSQSVSSSWINGKRTYSKTYSYVLMPTARGSFTIEQAAIEIAGETYKTLPQEVEVSEAVDRPNSQRTAEDVVGENLHLVAEVSKGDPYLNEAVSVVYKLYVGQNISVSNYRPLDNPRYTNFWSQDIPVGRHDVENGTYQGKPYRFVVLKRVVLYPQKSGALELEPLSLEVFVDVPTDQRDFFGRTIYTQTSQTVSAGKRTLQVKALPESGKPANFGGAVGEFDFSVSTSKQQLNAFESLQATVEVKGKGNLKLFQLPEPKIPSALEVYDPEYHENIQTPLSGMEGSISNSYTVVPSFRGHYPIPGISFSYFNPETESYVSLESQPISIEVLEGPLSTAADAPTTGRTEGPMVVPMGQQFHFIKLDADLVPMEQSPFYGSKAFFLWLLAPVLLIPVAIFFFRKREAMASDELGNKIKKANRLAKKYLSTAKRELGHKEAFYVALEKGLHNYLKAKLKIATSEFSKEKINDILMDKGVAPEDREIFIQLLTNCEMARYSPFSEVEMQQDYDRGSETISKLDKQL